MMMIMMMMMMVVMMMTMTMKTWIKTIVIRISNRREPGRPRTKMMMVVISIDDDLYEYDENIYERKG